MIRLEWNTTDAYGSYRYVSAISIMESGIYIPGMWIPYKAYAYYVAANSNLCFENAGTPRQQ